MRILIAEDDPFSRKLLQRRLEKWGHEVVAASDGKEAWDYFNKEDFQFVISDWMMPGMDGLELTRRIRSTPKNGYVYTILLTAKDRKEDLIQGMESGADEFLVKPVDIEELKVRMRAGERIIQLEKSLAERNKALEIANQRMKKDLEAAAKIQESLLPKSKPKFSNVDIYWYFKPCDELAGDFLNFFKLDKNHLAFYVLDVSGHGVSAALLSVTLSRLLSANPEESNLLVRKLKNSDEIEIVPPSEVANQLNRRFPIDLETGQYFTLLYGVLDVDEKHARVVSAGHPGMVYQPNEERARIIELPGLPIGIHEEIKYEENVFSMNPGERLFLYSDGLIEATNPRGEQFGKARLVETLTKKRTLPIRETVNSVINDLTNWREGEPFDDDVTLLGIEVKS